MRIEAAYNLIKENPVITVLELATSLNATKKQTENVIKRLKEDGRIRREGSSRNGKWIID